MMLAHILSEIDAILGRITESHLCRYDYLQCSLLTTDVFNDRLYRTRFNGYYRMQRRRQEWYDCFYSILECEKRNNAITFKDILNQIFLAARRVEASFSSKLVATIRPEMPVYDKYVRQNLSLEVPRQYERAQIRVDKYINAYAKLQTQMQALIAQPTFQELRMCFDRRYPAYSHFTNMKKLDLLLWQSR